jgi:hypothetical protein
MKSIDVSDVNRTHAFTKRLINWKNLMIMELMAAVDIFV